MPRFVILEHDYPQLHWDFMLEAGSALKTWRLAKPPEEKGESIAAVPLPEHRLDYLDYEGPVSAGRGTVKRWDDGTYELLAEDATDVVRVFLHGQRVQGVAAIECQGLGYVFRLDF
jgi:hypothetical protein